MQVDNILPEWGCYCDIEVVFMGLDIDKLLPIIGDFQRDGYSFEDKADLGWGCVFSKDNDVWVDRQKISNLAKDFLIMTDDLIRKARKHFPETKLMVRIGIYYDSFTFTLPFYQDLIKQMEQAGVDIEVSLYPSGVGWNQNKTDDSSPSLNIG